MKFGVVHLGRSGSGCQMAAAAANQLAADGHSVYLLVHENYRGQIRVVPGVEVQYANTYFTDSAIGYINPVGFARVLRMLTKVGPSIDGWYLPLGHFWMPALLPVMRHYAPIVSSLHEVGEKEGERYSASKLMHRMYLRADIRFSELLVVHSEHVRQGLKRVAGVDSLVAPLSPMQFGELPPEPEVILHPHQPLRLLMYGRLEPYKGVAIAIDAVRAVDQRNPGAVELHLVGRWPDSEPIAEASSESGSWLHHSSAYLKDEELCELIRSIDVILAPYLDATQSGVVASAFAEFRPVIVTNVGGLVEQVERDVTGLVCEPNAESLAAAIENLVADPHLVVSMSENIAERSEKLGWWWVTPLMIACATGATPPDLSTPAKEQPV